jgi:Gram-negative bacterial TonB protein C-terminal
MRMLIALAMLSLPILSYASNTPVEASMVVTGTITVNPDGSVQGYTLHGQDKLPPVVSQIVKQTVPRWQFKPIVADGKAVTAKTGMSLRIVADMTDPKHATIRVAGAEFGCNAGAGSHLADECDASPALGYVNRTPPRYPMQAARRGVGGEVFLVLQVGPDGHVVQSAVRQVNLYAFTDDQKFFRKVLANAALQVARDWRFKIPTAGPEATARQWIVEVPVNFTMNRPRDSCGSIPCSGSNNPYGWKAYIPGPVRDIPWSDEGAQRMSRSGTDAVARGTIFTRDDRFVLKTKFAESAG